MTPAPTERTQAAREHEPWRSRAFGIEIEGSFPAPGLPPARVAGTARPTRLAVVPGHDIDRRWLPGGGQRLLAEHFDDSPQPARTIDHRAGVGYRLFARNFGLAFVSEDGDEVLCAPPEDEPWSWQRFLVGRILPWAALLRGRELFHASAVTVGGGSLAVIGPTGAGKTSLAAQLVLRGAGFLTDDVLALEHDGTAIQAHPGAGIVSVRDGERAAIAAKDWTRLGSELGYSGKSYIELTREDGPAPLRAIYFLSRTARSPGITAVEAPDPRLLLGSTFIESVQTPARLRNQLSLCADLAQAVPMFTASVTAGLTAADLAQRMLTHMEALDT